MSDAETAVTETATKESGATEQGAWSPDARKEAFAAARAAHEASKATAQTETASEETEAEQPQQQPERKLPRASKSQEPAQQPTKPPKNGMGRREFFAAKQALAEQQAQATQSQSAAEKLSQLEKDLQDARSFQERQREAFRAGKYDDALKMVGVDGVDGFEALQKRVLAAMTDSPQEDTRISAMFEKLQQLEKREEERIAAQKAAEQRAWETEQETRLHQAVRETLENHEDPAVRAWSKAPGYADQVAKLLMNHPDATDEQIIATVTQSYDQLFEQMLATRGFTGDQARAIMSGKVAASPVRPSAKVAPSPAGNSGKPVVGSVTLPTSSAESSHAAPKWDPASRRNAWNAAKQSYRGNA